MSKSKGNVISPLDVAKNYGVEILRLWMLLSDFTGDLKISDSILKQVAEQYRKIRNTIRFLLANTNDLDFIDTRDFTFIDKWILSKASEVFKNAKEFFDRYEFSKGYNLILHFMIVELSGIYLDICKDRLYCDSKNSKRRISAQSALCLITKELLVLIAPTLTHTADEALEHANSIIKENANDVFDLVYKGDFNFDFSINDELLLSAREKFLENIDVLKKDKLIKSTLELCLQSSANEILSNDLSEIEDWFMVSQITSIDNNEEALCEFVVDDKQFRILKAKHHKCPRCWKFTAKNEDETCARCAKVLKEINV